MSSYDRPEPGTPPENSALSAAMVFCGTVAIAIGVMRVFDTGVGLGDVIVPIIAGCAIATQPTMRRAWYRMGYDDGRADEAAERGRRGRRVDG